MSDDDKKAAPAPAGGIGGDTAIRINVKHVLAATGLVISLAFGLAKWLYEKTHEDIQKNQEQIEKLREQLDEVDDRVRDNGYKIGRIIERQEAARRLAVLTDLDEDEARTVLDADVVPPVRKKRVRGARGTRAGRPFVEPRVTRDPLGELHDPEVWRSDLHQPSEAELRSTLRWIERRVEMLRAREIEPVEHLPDRDDDGLADGRDRCPDDPEVVNGYEDLDGCPDEVPMMVGTGPAGEEMHEEAPEPTETAARIFRLCMRDSVIEENLGEICRSCAHMDERECQSVVVTTLQKWRRAQTSQMRERPRDPEPHGFNEGMAPDAPMSRAEARRHRRLCRRNSWHLTCGRRVSLASELDAASDTVAALQKAERRRGRRRHR